MGLKEFLSRADQNLALIITIAPRKFSKKAQRKRKKDDAFYSLHTSTNTAINSQKKKQRHACCKNTRTIQYIWHSTHTQQHNSKAWKHLVYFKSIRLSLQPTLFSSSEKLINRHHPTMSTRVCHFKLVLLGDAAVGKSCLVVRFVRDEFYEFQEPTIGGKIILSAVPATLTLFAAK